MNHRPGAWKISRRTALRSLGACLALPQLDIMAADPASKTSPVRLAYLYFPNGAAEGTWAPRKTGPNGSLLQLNEWMSPLEPFKNDITLPRNVWTPRGNGHGAGTATWLTGGAYNGRKIHAGGVSADQIAARNIGMDTPLPSLELSTTGEGSFTGELSRNCISWTAPDIPAARETVPRTVFDRLFRRPAEGMSDRSVLDLVLRQAKDLQSQGSSQDQQKIEEYLEAVRSIERRIDFAESQSKRATREGVLSNTLTRPAAGIPLDHQSYIRQMLDLIAMAFWTDATRVSTFMLDHGQSNRYFNFIDGVEGTWHALSHWRDISGRTEDDDGETSWKSRGSKMQMYSAVTRWHHEQLAYLLNAMKQLPDGESNLLDNSLLLYGSSIADGHEHEAENLPLIVAGRGGGRVKAGREIPFRRQTSLSKLHLSFLKTAGVPVTRFGETQQEMSDLYA